LDLEARPRKKLDSQKVRYLTRKERAEYEVTFKDGLLIYAQSGKPVHTNPPPNMIVDNTRSLSIPNTTDALFMSSTTDTLSIPNTVDTEKPRSPSPAPSSQGSLNEEEQSTHEKWIYVTDCDGKFYVGQKIKGQFHHSSFLAGGAICAAGGIKVREGKLLEINPKSGHYKPAQHHFNALIERLKNEKISLDDDVKVVFPNEILEERLMAKYKFKRFALLSMVYDEFMRDAGNTINQQLDTVDRHVTKVSAHFKRNMSEAVKAGKESIKEWLQQVMPAETNKKEDHIR